MKKEIPVSQIMTTSLINLNLDDSLYKAEELFKKYHIRHLPVIKGKKLVGILSYTDLLRLGYADSIDDNLDADNFVYDTLSVRQVMMGKPVFVSSDTSIRKVSEILSEREFHALPVVNEDKDLVGIITTTDLIKYYHGLLYGV
ncbi:CBS domain-containing protein [Zhouia spongiae]|uniref:CBS domain-containing protein n=1 Tax=Zhouia spongiae TaxID=2202721 RepID=A0ABY3YIG0_9FLAO|nr:CBS domain-containing protein [Zhouia spongiae]UNY97311.1 CBS domain-containing protein [Zhouia spongiae]